jgi:hypothetical protein
VGVVMKNKLPFSMAPKWLKRYPGTFMANSIGRTIATYDAITDEVELTVYGSIQEYERELKYCQLWIVNGGRGILKDFS